MREAVFSREFAVRVLLVGVLAWLPPSVVVMGFGGEWAVTGEKLVQTAVVNPVTFLLAALTVQHLTRSRDWWRKGMNRWEFSGFAIVAGIVSLTACALLYAVVAGLASGPAALPGLLVESFLGVYLFILFTLYPLWCWLAALIIGPGAPPSSRAENDARLPAT